MGSEAARDPTAAGVQSRVGADLVSPILRSVSYTCRKNCRGIPCSPRMFCAGRQSLVKALHNLSCHVPRKDCQEHQGSALAHAWCRHCWWETSSPTTRMHARTALSLHSSMWARLTDALIFSLFPGPEMPPSCPAHMTAQLPGGGSVWGPSPACAALPSPRTVPGPAARPQRLHISPPLRPQPLANTGPLVPRTA